MTCSFTLTCSALTLDWLHSQSPLCDPDCWSVPPQGAMMSIAYKEGLKVPPPALNEIILASNQDIRQVKIGKLTTRGKSPLPPKKIDDMEP